MCFLSCYLVLLSLVFCFFFLINMCVQSLSHMTPWRLQPKRLLCAWDIPGKNTGACCHFLLQGICLTQGSNPCLLCLLHCRLVLYHWRHLGSPLRHMYTSNTNFITSLNVRILLYFYFDIWSCRFNYTLTNMHISTCFNLESLITQ